MNEPTYIFEGDKAYAMVDGKVVASAKSVEELEAKVADWDPYAHGSPDFGGEDFSDPAGNQFVDDSTCPHCGTVGALAHGEPICPRCGAPNEAAIPQHDDYSGEGADLPAASPDTLPGDDLPPRHTHIVTPNGLKGQILGRHKDLWGEEVTVRFENGRIASFHVAENDENEYVNEEEEDEKKNPIENLKKKVEKETSHDRASIQERLAELTSIKKETSHLIQTGVSYDDEVVLDEIRLQADYETGELAAALEQIDSEEADAYRPPAPYGYNSVEQETVGGGDGTWLDNTLGEMIEEAEGQDYDQMMQEGPELFVADLEDAPLADAGVVRQMASSFIRSKTAGIDPEAVKEYEKIFLARVEAARKEAQKQRKEEMKKEAADDTGGSLDNDGPAEGLFI